MQRILVEGPSRRPGKDANGESIAELMGRTACNRIVNFAGGPHQARLVGKMLNVRITEALPHSLRGSLVLADGAPLGASISVPDQSPATTA
jgi:tRNA-2-methylthio-N6-dimethylallyladenosine synthase